jgi:hypothetical protein
VFTTQKRTKTTEEENAVQLLSLGQKLEFVIRGFVQWRKPFSRLFFAAGQPTRPHRLGAYIFSAKLKREREKQVGLTKDDFDLDALSEN